MLPGATGERGISRRQVHQVVEIGTREADRPLLVLQRNPRMATKLSSAFPALGVTMRYEDLYVIHGKEPDTFQLGVESRAARGMATRMTPTTRSSTHE